MQGPNVKELIAHKMSLDAVPAGGGVKDALALTEPGRIVQTARDATAWVAEAIKMVRGAAEPNPWRNADDETIAGDVLKIEEKKGGGQR